jgi:hypothetical protein
MLLLYIIYLWNFPPQNILISKNAICISEGDYLSHEENAKPDLSKYYPVSEEITITELPDLTLKNIALAFFLLGLIAFMVNALMVYLYMRQEWVIIWPQTSGAQIGVILMIFAGALYFVNYMFEKKNL